MAELKSRDACRPRGCGQKTFAERTTHDLRDHTLDSYGWCRCRAPSEHLKSAPAAAATHSVAAATRAARRVVDDGEDGVEAPQAILRAGLNVGRPHAAPVDVKEPLSLEESAHRRGNPLWRRLPHLRLVPCLRLPRLRRHSLCRHSLCLCRRLRGWAWEGLAGAERRDALSKRRARRQRGGIEVAVAGGTAGEGRLAARPLPHGRLWARFREGSWRAPSSNLEHASLPRSRAA